ncbi:LOW QUALITY PROTEIN: hypothetical protein Myrod_2160 [Myroides odoratus DSM 2801]|nr:LOW QUALITY PROTEIN: hypothetical protein Myrod_2160 [Myroides odoratus DSM 2801]
MKYKLLALAGLALLCSSCITITGLTSDYKKLDPASTPYLATYEAGKDTLPNRLYRITGEQIRQQMEQHDKILVYTFANGCSGSTCYPLATFKRWAEENGYKLYLVTVGYNNLGATLNQQVNLPLYVIDYKAYHTNMRGKYYDRFLLDLLKNEVNSTEIVHKQNASLYAFEKGKLTQASNDLLQLEPKFVQ